MSRLKFLSAAHPEERSDEGSLKKSMKNPRGFIYILTNERSNVLYVGSTQDLINRIQEHRKGYQKGFTRKYNVHRLIYYEMVMS